jgi:hypothetical protein
LVFDPGVYTPQSCTIVSAGSVSGKFTAVTGAKPSNLAQALSYSPTAVALQLSSIPAPATASTSSPATKAGHCKSKGISRV